MMQEAKCIIYIIARQDLKPIHNIRNNALVYSTICGGGSRLLSQILKRYKFVELFIFKPFTPKQIFYLSFTDGRISTRVAFSIIGIKIKNYSRPEDYR